MTPLQTELFQQLGILCLYNVQELSIGIVFYGVSCSLLVYGPSTSLIKGVFIGLFSASVVIFVFVPSSPRVTYFLTSPDPTRFYRRRGFSNRLAAAIFVVTVINCLLFSLNTGTQVAVFIALIQKTLIILDTDYPLRERQDVVNSALRNLKIVNYWSESLPVSNNLSLLDSVSIHALWRYYSVISLSFGGLGPSSKINSLG